MDANKFSQNFFMQKFTQDVRMEKEIKDRIHQYEVLAKNLTEISKKSTSEVMVCSNNNNLYFRFLSAMSGFSGDRSNTRTSSWSSWAMGILYKGPHMSVSL